MSEDLTKEQVIERVKALQKAISECYALEKNKHIWKTSLVSLVGNFLAASNDPQRELQLALKFFTERIKEDD